MSAGKYTGGFGRFLMAMAVVTATWLGADAAPPEARSWDPEPAYVGLFTPALPKAAYAAYVSPDSLDIVLDQITRDPAAEHPPGSWTPRLTQALDAFGRTGTYNPWALARLYRALRPRVVRGPRRDETGRLESWTLISPYPDPLLTRLEPGTLLIVVRVR